jgi:uncharacterized protein
MVFRGPGGVRRRSASGAVLAQWLMLLVLSVVLSLLWSAVHLPAALLIGPMVAGIVFGARGVRLPVPAVLYQGAQAVIAALVAASITPATLATFRHNAPLFALVTAATLLGAAAIGWLVSRLGWIAGSSAVYGTCPGAATAMVMLSEAEGADPRLVAVMQYSRVLLVALGAALVARFWVGASGAKIPGSPWFASVAWLSLGELLSLAVLGQLLARLLRLQAWALLGPMVLLATLHALGWISIELPRWLLALAYALLGWHIGMGFQRQDLLHARHVLPVVVAASLALIGFCAALAWLLAYHEHMDALTAYLATSPGGLDSIAIIAAATSRVDLPLVLGLQSVRLFVVIACAPALAQFVVRHSPHLRAVGGDSGAARAKDSP